jgi:hypothetical protein
VCMQQICTAEGWRCHIAFADSTCDYQHLTAPVTTST